MTEGTKGNVRFITSFRLTTRKVINKNHTPLPEKGDVLLSTIHTLHYPYLLPKGWEWCKLEDFINEATDFVASGSFASLRENVKYYDEPKYAVLIRTKDFQNNFTKDLVYTDKHGYEFLSNSNLFGGELILPNIGASIGKVFIVPYLQERMTLAPNSIMIRCYKNTHKEWLQYLFLSPFGQEQLRIISSSTAQGKFNKTDLRTLNILIPPLTEQERIVTEIERCFALIDEIEQSKFDLQTIISQTKSKILDLAIHGKLVPQDPNDEPAIELLKRINPDFTPCDNGHSGKLPQGWCNCKISDVSISLLGKTLDRGKNTGNLKKYLCAVNVKWGTFELSTVKEMPIEATELERYSVKFGDLMVCEGGDVGRAAIWTYNSKMYYQNALHRIRFKENISAHYFLYSLMYLKLIGVIDDVCKGVTIKHLTQNAMNTLKFNLPPIAEQQRIVQKIEELFSILDNIQNALEV